MLIIPYFRFCVLWFKFFLSASFEQQTFSSAVYWITHKYKPQKENLKEPLKVYETTMLLPWHRISYIQNIWIHFNYTIQSTIMNQRYDFKICCLNSAASHCLCSIIVPYEASRLVIKLNICQRNIHNILKLRCPIFSEQLYVRVSQRWV
jgi:hypothetical protein